MFISTKQTTFNQEWNRGSWLLSLAILVPLFLSFTLPLVFYQPPIFVSYTAQLTFHQVMGSDLWRAYGIVLVWFSLVLISFFTPILSINRNQESVKDWAPSAAGLAVMAFTALSFMGNIVNTFLQVPHIFSQVFFIVSWLSTAAVGMALFMFKVYTLTVVQRRFLIGLLLVNTVIIVLFPLVQGSANPIFYNIVAALFTLLVLRYSHKILLFGFLLSIVLVVATMIGKNYIRDYTALYNSSSSSFLVFKRKIERKHILNSEKISSFDYQSFKFIDPNFNRLYTSDLPYLSFTNYVIERILDRINHLGEMAYVVKTTPSKLDYTYGQTYRPLLYMFIPRILWPNKPVDNLGQFFGKRYGFIGDRGDTTTSWAMTLPAEAWMNFGWWGIVLSAIAIGMLLKLLRYLFLRNPLTVRQVAYCSLVVFTAAKCETGTHMMIGTLAHVLVVMWFIDLMIRKFSLQWLFGLLKKSKPFERVS